MCFLTEGQALKLDAPTGFFPPSHIETEKKFLHYGKDSGILRFSILCLYSLKFLLLPVSQDLSVTVIPKGNINSENRFPSL